MTTNHNIWQWQEPGSAWKGAGLYHVTLTIPSREPLFGRLEIPEDNPKQARVVALSLGRAVLAVQKNLSSFYPEIQILHYCLMPDHLHSVWYVRQTMPRGINAAVRGFWQEIKKTGRAYSYLSSINPNSIRENNQERISLADIQAIASTLRDTIGADVYDNLQPIFAEMPFIRPMGQRRQLPTVIRYIDMNPQRLATKRLTPEYFCVQEGIEIAGRMYRGVGNVKLLHETKYMPVHVRSVWVEDAERHGYDKPLRDYMNGCVLAARNGVVMVSPFISKQEKMVMEVLLKEWHPFIYIADNGFRDYYKPHEALFDAVAEGRVLILSPWEYDAEKKHVSRADCVAMNKMAEEICGEMTIEKQ